MKEKQINHFIAFLDVFISVIDYQNITLQTYHKSTYTALLLQCKSFTSFSYKISLIKCLIGRLFRICNNWNSFGNDIEYPPLLDHKVIKKYLDDKFCSNKNELKDASVIYYFKLPYIDNLLHYVKSKLSRLCKEFCQENFNIKINNIKFVFNSLKTKNYFSIKT